MKLPILARVAGGTFGLYLAYCLLLFLLQRQFLFPRFRINVPWGVAERIPGLEKFWLDTTYGKIEAWFLPPAPNRGTEPAPAIIFAHGNGELIDFWPEQLNAFTLLGIGVLLVEYPGYGRSEGTPSQESITGGFIAAYDILVTREDVDASRIVLFGRSLGGGAVCRLAVNRPSVALILLSTFTSVESLASKFLVPSFIVQDPFDNLAVVGSYAAPVLVAHGKNDDLIPYSHGLALYQAAKRGKMLTYDCGHNNCPSGWGRFLRDVESFLHGAGII